MPHPARSKTFGRRVPRPRRVRDRKTRQAGVILKRLGRLSGWLLAGVVTVFSLLALARLTGIWQSESEQAVSPSVLRSSEATGAATLGRRVTPVRPPPERPAWLRYAAETPESDASARVVVVIDDLGLDRAALERLLSLPGPLTLSFLPYAEGLERQTRAARRAGHELLVHLPMAPKSGLSDPGPMALLAGLDEAELARRLNWNLSRFSGFVGVNNHMGSRLTEESSAMRQVMRALAGRGLLFLDSRTTPETVAQRQAAAAGLPNAARDVFLDNEQSAEAVAKGLDSLESLARHTGLAIGIGHPHPETIAALAAWLPGLAERGVVLVPISAAVKAPETARAAGVSPVPSPGGASSH